jgi:hypothetical protein
MWMSHRFQGKVRAEASTERLFFAKGVKDARDRPADLNSGIAVLKATPNDLALGAHKLGVERNHRVRTAS